MASSLWKARSTALPDPVLEAQLANTLVSPRAMFPSWLGTALCVVVTLLALEQWLWRHRKKHLPGVKWPIPLIGAFNDSRHPTMEAYHKTWATPMSCASVFNIFIVMVSDNALTRKVLNSPTYAEPCLVYSAKQVLDPTNWVFLSGKVHAEYRKGLNVLFTRKGLAIYLKRMEAIRRTHFARWLANPGGPEAMMPKFRELNMDTSLRVFCGEYISPAAAQEISDKYWLITRALELVNFPLALPGTKVYKAIHARKVAMRHLEAGADASKAKIRAGGECTCLLDNWNQDLLEAGQLDKYSSNEQALVVLSFIFASQDAMSSSLTFGFQLLADRPDVFAKLREEQERIRGGNYEQDVTLDQLDQMTYTRALVKEVLRYRPPVIMVPYKTTKAMPITPDYTVPKGSILIPSFWNSTHDPAVYPDPETFDPDRFLPGGNSAEADPKHFLVFGSGPHKCIGQEYVYMHMASVLGTAAALMDFEHARTPTSEDIKIIATLFPKDDCLMKFTPRR